ncbi:MAG: 30S ribosomal protein S1, partial [Micropruina sp.]|nr:30S ribosomal protein S1 [Micropruina sp.]
ERQYAEAQARWEAHKQQVKDAEAAIVEAAVAEVSTAAYSAGGAPATRGEQQGSLASDEALQALRDRLTGSR